MRSQQVTAFQINLFRQLQQNIVEPFFLPQLLEISFNLKNYQISTNPQLAQNCSFDQIFPQWNTINKVVAKINPPNQFTFKSLIANIKVTTIDSPIIKEALNYLCSLPKQKLVFQFCFTSTNDLQKTSENYFLSGWTKIGWQVELENIAQIILTEAHQTQKNLDFLKQEYLKILIDNKYLPANNYQLDVLLHTALVYNLLTTRPQTPNRLDLLKQILNKHND